MRDAKKSPKIRRLHTITQLCRAISKQLRHVSTIRKKHCSTAILLHTFSQYGELRTTSGWDRLPSLRAPHSKFQRVSRFGFVTAATSLNGRQPNFARCLAVSWAGTLCIHFWRLLPPDRILPRARLTLCPSHAFFYIDSLILHGTPAADVSQTLQRGTRNGITELSQTAPPVFVWAAITFGIGPHF